MDGVQGERRRLRGAVGRTMQDNEQKGSLEYGGGESIVSTLRFYMNLGTVYPGEGSLYWCLCIRKCMFVCVYVWERITRSWYSNTQPTHLQSSQTIHTPTRCSVLLQTTLLHEHYIHSRTQSWNSGAPNDDQTKQAPDTLFQQTRKTETTTSTSRTHGGVGWHRFRTYREDNPCFKQRISPRVSKAT